MFISPVASGRDALIFAQVSNHEKSHYSREFSFHGNYVSWFRFRGLRWKCILPLSFSPSLPPPSLGPRRSYNCNCSLVQPLRYSISRANCNLTTRALHTRDPFTRRTFGGEGGGGRGGGGALVLSVGGPEHVSSNLCASICTRRLLKAEAINLPFIRLSQSRGANANMHTSLTDYPLRGRDSEQHYCTYATREEDQ